MKQLQETRDVKYVSDGYHTFDELYGHRCLLYIALCLANKDKCGWKPHYEGWPVLYFNSSAGQITYHIDEKKFGGLFKDKIRRDDSFVWDGHTSDDVLARLARHCGDSK